MKKVYVLPRCRQVEIDASIMIAESLPSGGDGNDGDEAEVRQETHFTTGNASLWDNEW